MPHFAYSNETTLPVHASEEALFAYLDDHRNLSLHMEKPSWAMMGSKMQIHMDEKATRAVGSRFGFAGSFLGIPLAVEEIVTDRRPPAMKTWVTTGEPTLWVIGRYRMGFRIAPRPGVSLLSVFIEYDLPPGSATRILGWLLGGFYARWCTRRMCTDAQRHFRVARGASG